MSSWFKSKPSSLSKSAPSKQQAEPEIDDEYIDIDDMLDAKIINTRSDEFALPSPALKPAPVEDDSDDIPDMEDDDDAPATPGNYGTMTDAEREIVRKAMEALNDNVDNEIPDVLSTGHLVLEDGSIIVDPFPLESDDEDDDEGVPVPKAVERNTSEDMVLPPLPEHAGLLERDINGGWGIAKADSREGVSLRRKEDQEDVRSTAATGADLLRVSTNISQSSSPSHHSTSTYTSSQLAWGRKSGFMTLNPGYCAPHEQEGEGRFALKPMEERLGIFDLHKNVATLETSNADLVETVNELRAGLQEQSDKLECIQAQQSQSCVDLEMRVILIEKRMAAESEDSSSESIRKDFEALVQAVKDQQSAASRMEERLMSSIIRRDDVIQGLTEQISGWIEAHSRGFAEANGQIQALKERMSQREEAVTQALDSLARNQKAQQAQRSQQTRQIQQTQPTQQTRQTQPSRPAQPAQSAQLAQSFEQRRASRSQQTQPHRDSQADSRSQASSRPEANTGRRMGSSITSSRGDGAANSYSWNAHAAHSAVHHWFPECKYCLEPFL